MDKKDEMMIVSRDSVINRIYAIRAQKVMLALN